MGVQGAQHAARQGLEAHRSAMQAGLAEAASLVAAAAHSGQQHCTDGELPQLSLLQLHLPKPCAETRLRDILRGKVLAHRRTCTPESWEAASVIAGWAASCGCRQWPACLQNLHACTAAQCQLEVCVISRRCTSASDVSRSSGQAHGHTARAAVQQTDDSQEQAVKECDPQWC